MRVRLRVVNHSGYRTRDLHAFIERAMRAYRVAGPLTVIVTASPIRSRGCADVGGSRMSIAIAPPSAFSLRRMARLVQHELAHIAGIDHESMPYDLLYCLGNTPSWAKGARFGYVGRAPNQMRVLARHASR